MVVYGQLVIGPAGCGKSTYCSTLQAHCDALTGRSKRRMMVANLDPAAESFAYEPLADIRDLVSVDEVVTELELGPNGALVAAMEFLSENLEWIDEIVADLIDGDYVLFDCPGQLELYSHTSIMSTIVRHLEKLDVRLCAVYLLDATFLDNVPKFVGGALSALAAMIRLELPHVNVVSKVDMVLETLNKKTLEKVQDQQRAEEDSDENDDEEDDEDYDVDDSNGSKIRPTSKLRAKLAKKLEAERRRNEPPSRDLSDLSSLMGALITHTSETGDDSFFDDEDGEEFAPLLLEAIRSLPVSHPDQMPFYELNQAIADLLEQYSMLSFVPFDIRSEETIQTLIMKIDMVLQIDEGKEVKAEYEEAEEDEQDGGQHREENGYDAMYEYDEFE